MKKLICLLLSVLVTASMYSCGNVNSVSELSADVKPGRTEQDVTGRVVSGSYDDFAVRLAELSFSEGKNSLVSPLSVAMALTMAANGAENATLSQMESALGMSRAEANAFLNAFITANTDSDAKFSVANSIWIKTDPELTVKNEFLEKNITYFGAKTFEAAFDSETVKAINEWVYSNTDKMIDKIVDSLSPDIVMCLINALSFDAKWAKVYENTQVRDGEFTAVNGTKQKVKMMYSGERKYLENEKATGFIKDYAGRKYAFAALLPKEGVSISDCLASLTDGGLHALLSSPLSVTVNASIPKFETEYDLTLNDVLTEMGMTNAFDEIKADFSSLGSANDGNLYISQVLHKTRISVFEQGTKAGAATAVLIAKETAMIPIEEKNVFLDRPFVYMIIDTETSTPIFIGTLNSVK